MKTYLSIFIFAILLGLMALLPASSRADFPDVCQQAENVLPNCNFNEGMNHWQPFLETGSADVSVLQGGGGCHAPLCPAAYVVTNNYFIGGILQQVKVTKGANYYANIVWLVFDTLVNDAGINQAVGGGIGRRIGIDPFGGTDPKSANVVWSEDNWRNDCKICNVEQVTVTAQSDTITVFLRLDDTWRQRAAKKGYNVPTSKDQFWIDDIGMKQVGGSPVVAAAVASPTVAAVSPVETPTPAPQNTAASANAAAAQPTAAKVKNTATPAETPTATSTVPPTVTPTTTSTPLPTLTPTTTPSPTATMPPRPTRMPTPPHHATSTPPGAANLSVLGTVGTAVCLGGGGLVVAAVVLLGLVWLYRLGWGKPANDD